MTVEIPVEQQQFVIDSVARGEYRTEGELVSDALRILEERQRTNEYLRREMQLGFDDFDRGDYEVYDDASLNDLCEQIKMEGREELDQESGAS
jgi:putative addiction module CopG family antidote